MSNRTPVEFLVESIPMLKKSSKIEPILKGYSSDEKYLIESSDGEKQILRVFDLNQYEAKQSEYEILKKMNEYQVKSSRPLILGKIPTKGYMIVSHLEGRDASDELPNYTENEQFQIGIEAGKELRKMHQLQAPSQIPPWYDRKLKKNQNYLDAYLGCGVKVKDDARIISFINENISLMKHRPNIFQHDDFHVGNIIVNDKKYVGAIDFNRFDWGDPVHEFLKVGIFSREISVPFCIGQIKGYHNDEEPSELFWRLYALYLAMCVFSTVVWTLRVVPDQMNEMLGKIDMFLEDHKYFTKTKPSWYRQG